MIYTPLTIRAMQVAYAAHHGQADKLGVPYIFHPFHLAEQMSDEATTCVALLHDVVEDTSMTVAELARLFPPEIVEAVRLLTHDKTVDYFDYVRKIATNAIATAVKLADLAHNADPARASLTDEAPEARVARLAKYARARALLSAASPA